MAKKYAIRICTPDYVAAHEDAERRIKLGQKQRLDPRCGRWHWRNERCEHTRLKASVGKVSPRVMRLISAVENLLLERPKLYNSPLHKAWLAITEKRRPR